jgi:hypothetical protein
MLFDNPNPHMTKKNPLMTTFQRLGVIYKPKTQYIFPLLFGGVLKNLNTYSKPFHFLKCPTIYNSFASYTQLVPIPNWLGIMDKKGVKKNGSSSPPGALPYT